nr:hypothetical protein [Tanacetum cinerariifolium]
MAAKQEIDDAPQCGDLTMESLAFYNNNVMVVYQNFLREFWCITIAYDLNPPNNDSEAHPLKGYLIKFLVMIGKNPLIRDYKTFVESTCVSHPSLGAVKAELAKIVENPILLDMTPVLKNSFPVAWRILCTFSIQVLDGNYSSTKYINSIQKMITYCLITGTKVDIEEVIYNDLITKITSKSRQKYVSYPRFISCALKVLLGSDYTQDETFGSSTTNLSNSNFSKDPSRVTEIELTALMIVVNNQKDSVSPLPFSRKKKKVKSQTVTPTLPKSQGLKASGPANKGLPDSDKGTVKTTTLPEGPHGDKDSERLKPPADMEPLTNRVADHGLVLKSDEDDMLEAGEEMDEDIPPTDGEVQSSPPNKEQPEPSHAQESDSDSFSPEPKKYYNIIPLTKRQLEVVKEDPALNKKVLKATEAYIANSHHLTKLLYLAKTFDFFGLKSLVENVKATIDAYNDHLETWAKSSISMAWNVGPRLTKIAHSDSYTGGYLVPQLTKEQTQAHMDKEKQIKKAIEEAKMFEMIKTEVIKVVQEEAEKIKLDPKTIISAKAGEKFKKTQDDEHQVLRREHS